MTLTRNDILNEGQLLRNRFDPNHPSYHHGNPIPVPLGGTRIPAGLLKRNKAATADELSLEDTRECSEMIIERKIIRSFKSNCVSATRYIADITDYHKGSSRSTLEHNEEQLAIAMKQLEQILESYKLKATSKYMNETILIMKQLIEHFRLRPCNKTEYGEFILQLNTQSRILFRIQTNLLNDVKQRKNELLKTANTFNNNFVLPSTSIS